MEGQLAWPRFLVTQGHVEGEVFSSKLGIGKTTTYNFTEIKNLQMTVKFSQPTSIRPWAKNDLKRI